MSKLSGQISAKMTFLKELIQKCNMEKNSTSESFLDFTIFSFRNLFEKMIVFLSNKHMEGEKFSILTRSGCVCEVELDTNSGFVFESIVNAKGVILYLGEGTSSYKTHPIIRFPTFLIMDDKGVSYWDNIKDLHTAIIYGDAIPYGDQPLKNVQPKRKLLNFGNLLSLYKKNNLKSNKILSESMDVLSDAVIQCRDGDVKIVKYLFAKDSEFFLHLFRYEAKMREFKMDFDKIVLQTYLDYHLSLIGVKPNVEMICEDVIQFIEFGFFIQDIHFVRIIYNLVVEECDNDTLVKLNESIQKIVPFD